MCTFQCNYLKNVLFTTDNQTSNITDYSKYTVNDFLSQLLNETYDNNKQPSILSLDIYNISSKNVNDYWKLEKQRFWAKNIEFMLRKLSNYVK